MSPRNPGGPAPIYPGPSPSPPACPNSRPFPCPHRGRESGRGPSLLGLTGPSFRDLVSLGISSAEHREALLSGISALRARVLQMQGQGVQV